MSYQHCFCRLWLPPWFYHWRRLCWRTRTPAVPLLGAGLAFPPLSGGTQPGTQSYCQRICIRWIHRYLWISSKHQSNDRSSTWVIVQFCSIDRYISQCALANVHWPNSALIDWHQEWSRKSIGCTNWFAHICWKSILIDQVQQLLWIQTDDIHWLFDHCTLINVRILSLIK